jgi:hypothetical protein
MVFNSKYALVALATLALLLTTGWLWVSRVELKQQLADSQQNRVVFNTLLQAFIARNGPAAANSERWHTDEKMKTWLVLMLQQQKGEEAVVTLLSENRFQLVFNVFDTADLIDILFTIENEPQISVASLIVKPLVGELGLSVELRCLRYD